jgi:hypothetical protein
MQNSGHSPEFLYRIIFERWVLSLLLRQLADSQGTALLLDQARTQSYWQLQKIQQ